MSDELGPTWADPAVRAAVREVTSGPGAVSPMDLLRQAERDVVSAASAWESATAFPTLTAAHGHRVRNAEERVRVAVLAYRAALDAMIAESVGDR